MTGIDILQITSHCDHATSVFLVDFHCWEPNGKVSLNNTDTIVCPIGHFQVLLCLRFKTSLSAKPFIWKWALHAVSFSCISHFHKNGFALRLALKQRHKGTRKWPISCILFLFNYPDWYLIWPCCVKQTTDLQLRTLSVIMLDDVSCMTYLIYCHILSCIME